MATRSSSLSPVRFDHFELDLRTGELRREGACLKLQPQPAKVLSLLVSRAGEVVARPEIAREVWGSDTFVDFEQGLNFAIRQIRSVLNDDADHPQFLETVPKRGYRFIGAIEKTSASTIVEPTVTDSAPGHRVGWPQRRWGLTVGLSVLVLIAGLTAARLFFFSGPRVQSASPDIRSIAVLPLENLSASPDQEYFADGLTDELITELAKTGRLRVISRTSVMGYRGAHKRIPEIARELHVDAIVEGTVERSGNRVRVRAQLIHGVSDQHLWADTYDRDLSDLLHLEFEVAADIARHVGHVASGREDQIAKSRKVSVGAHEDYLRGRYYWNKRTESGLRKGIEYFERAIEQDPAYPLPYAGIADSYIMLANWDYMPATEAYPKAKAAAAKALELDDQLAEAYTSLAYASLLYDWDWRGSEERFRHAIELDPNYATAHHFYSIYLMAAGRHAEAQAEIARALELDPLSLIINSVASWIYYEGREYDKALQQSQRALDMDPRYTPALVDHGMVYLRTGEYQKAIAQFENARSIAGDQGVILSYLAQARALAGDQIGARNILLQIKGNSARRAVSTWDIALIYSALGEKDKAIAALQQAADEHVGWVIRLGVDPALDPLRTDPRFLSLLRRVRPVHA